MIENIEKVKARFNNFIEIDEVTGCHLWVGSEKSNGYGAFSLKYGGKHKTMRAHRVAYMLEYGSIPEGISILHKCDRPSCVSVKCLFPGTHADNMADKIKKGRQPKGSDHINSKLTEEDVINIRSLYADGKMTQAQLALRFGVSRRSIYQVIHRITWTHV